MVTVAIVYHSGYGHTKAVAESVAKGAGSVPGTTVDLINVDDVDGKWDDLAKADAIIFGAPTYMGSLSGPFKTFMDKSSKVWFGQGWKNKIAAGFTNSGSQSGDKLNSLLQLAVFAGQQSMIWVGTGMMPGNNSSTASIEDLNRIGSFLGLMTQANVDQGPDVAPPAQDHKTAHLFGERVAHIAHRWVKGGE
jgi:NAD(P)H dehydrogenase (quinone)